ncbi:purine catabolism protein PucG [Mycolicibacterium canariasense]|uniref:Purine catabolism protein PucG n=1 Tax=Mycolicibacterium canariasense TaxID=228230 RepID=A0A124E356_MYCCR|nr:hypothetical protein [Mycolicibacterium canariasense]MCV7210196.1 hypothetical protein [Mycolicibacterium canariasense]ORU98467.1 hypothetical protein AWB94_28400 [Mycolicibacterium canariasense]GAS98854.1 purine catabolism protein PucG [Mycolicibacterium canariasense]
MNHFAEAERLLAKADDCVVESITRNLVARAAAHAQLAQVQALEQAFGLPPAVVDAQVTPDVLAAYGIETRTTTGDKL